jgi:enolase-phosphatase E1
VRHKPAASGIAAILLDIEGTTTPITFVTRVLFPYARAHLRSYLEEHPSSAGHDAAYFESLMDRDDKSTSLKELQGRIWEIGYRRGEIVGEVFPDVPRALQRWHDDGCLVGIFSSGSVLAQQLLFRHSSYGDLTQFVRSHFDTHIGTKADTESYRCIAQQLDLSAGAVLFLSDVTRELDAASEAGMQVCLVTRPGNVAPSEPHRYREITTFDVLFEGG